MSFEREKQEETAPASSTSPILAVDETRLLLNYHSDGGTGTGTNTDRNLAATTAAAGGTITVVNASLIRSTRTTEGDTDTGTDTDHEDKDAVLRKSTAKIDPQFFHNVWRLIRIITLYHPLYMMIVEFISVVSVTALLLTILPIPSSYAALSEPVPDKISLGAIVPILLLSIIIQIIYAVSDYYRRQQQQQISEKEKETATAMQCNSSSSNTTVWWTTEIKKRSIPLLFLFAQTYNISGFFTMLIPSLMYMALVTNPPNCNEFPLLFGQAMGYIICVSIFKSLLQFYTESTTLLWRQVLTAKLHTLYTQRGKAYYQLLLLFPATTTTTTTSGGKSTTTNGGIDNPDQRIAQEINYWCTTLSELLQVVAIAFFDISFYTFQLWIITGWPGPIIIFCFFILSSIVTQIAAWRVPSLLAFANQAEGDFRIVHTTLLQQAEATAMMSGGAVEKYALDDSFDELLRRRWRYVRRQAILNLDVYFWQYTGSIINYVAIAIAVCGGLYADLSPAELSSLISRGSGFAISMVYGCTNLLAATVQLASLAGYTYRVIQLLDGLEETERIAENWKNEEHDDANYDENREDGTGIVNSKKNTTHNRHKAARGSTDNDSAIGNQLHRIKLELSTDDIPTNPDSLSSFRLLTTLRLCVRVPQNANNPPVLVRESNNSNSDNSGDTCSNSDEHNLLIESYRGNLPLLNSIDIDVKPKGSVLIRGPPGIGKSSILRTVCRLWPMGHDLTSSSSSEISCIPPIWDHCAVGATVKREGNIALFFLALPQTAPFRIGVETSLFEQLTYPLLLLSSNDSIVRAKVKEALNIVGLPHMLTKARGLDAKHSHRKFSEMMSPGQRQLFAIARIFVHQPTLVFLDEATSSMPAVDEERVYKAMAEEGIAYVSVGHRDSLIAHHDQIVDCGAMFR